MKKSIILVAGIIGLIATTAFAGPVPPPPPPEDTLAEEILYRLETNGDTISIDVVSTGCTKTKDFKFLITVNQEATVVRIKPDLCKAIPHIKTLTYKRSVLGLTQGVPMTISNPFGLDNIIKF